MFMRKEQLHISLKIAATYIGTVVGAGFATGKEIVHFFSVHGAYGFIGIIFSGFLFIWIGTKMMRISVEIHAFSAQDFNKYLFGDTVGNIINGIITVGLLAVTSVMLSGAGAVFEEQLGLSRQFGIILIAIISLIVLSGGLDGVLSVNTIVVPIMMLFIIGVSSTAIFEAVPNTIKATPIESWNYKWLTNPLTYAALNITLAQSVLVPLAGNIKDKSVITLGGILGGVGLTCILILSHIAIISVDSFYDYSVPMAEVVKRVNPTFHFLFIFIIIGEILTTVIGNVYGISKQIESIIPIRPFVIVCVILTFSYTVSFIHYSPLLGFIYPLIGWISFVFLPMIAIKKSGKS